MENGRLINEMARIENGQLHMSADGAINMKAVGIATSTVEGLTKTGAFSVETADSYDSSNPTPISTENLSELERLNISVPDFVGTSVAPTTETTQTPNPEDEPEQMEMPSLGGPGEAQEPASTPTNLFVGGVAPLEESTPAVSTEPTSNSSLSQPVDSLSTSNNTSSQPLDPALISLVGLVGDSATNMNPSDTVEEAKAEETFPNPMDLSSLGGPSEEPSTLVDNKPLDDKSLAEIKKSLEEAREQINLALGSLERIIGKDESEIKPLGIQDSMGDNITGEKIIEDIPSSLDNNEPTDFAVPSLSPTLGAQTGGSTSDLINPMADMGGAVSDVDETPIMPGQGKFIQF